MADQVVNTSPPVPAPVITGVGRFLFETQWADYNGVPNLGWKVNDRMFAPVPDLCIMASNWGISNLNIRHHGTVKIQFSNGSDEDGLMADRLSEIPPIPDYEPFELIKWLGAGSIYTGMAYMVNCGDNNLTFDLEVVNAKTGDIVHCITGISASQSVFSGGDANIRHLIKGGEPLMIKLRFNELPYKFDGMHSWWSKDRCEGPPCFDIHAHFFVEDTCLAPRIRGCSAAASNCCDMIPCEPCCKPVHRNPKPCVADPCGTGPQGACPEPPPDCGNPPPTEDCGCSGGDPQPPIAPKVRPNRRRNG